MTKINYTATIQIASKTNASKKTCKELENLIKPLGIYGGEIHSGSPNNDWIFFVKSVKPLLESNRISLGIIRKTVTPDGCPLFDYMPSFDLGICWQNSHIVSAEIYNCKIIQAGEFLEFKPDNSIQLRRGNIGLHWGISPISLRKRFKTFLRTVENEYLKSSNGYFKLANDTHSYDFITDLDDEVIRKKFHRQTEQEEILNAYNNAFGFIDDDNASFDCDFVLDEDELLSRYDCDDDECI